MKKTMKKFIAVLLTVVMVLPIAGLTVNKSQASVNYNRTAALNYAKAHWNDGVGQCAQFVSACLTAGGLSVSQNVCLNLWNTLKNYGTPYKLTATSSGNGNIKLSSNTGKVEAGDPLFYVCDTCGGVNSNKAFPHVVFCGGTDSQGRLTAYGHNAAWNNKLVWTQFSTGAHAGHKTNIYSIHINAASSYTLTYNANGGYGAPATQTGATKYTISSTIPKRFGYTFCGWTGNGGYSYDPGNNITLSQNTTIYAVWENDSYTQRLCYSGQEVYYKYIPASSGYYCIETTHHISDDIDVKSYLYDSAGNELAYNDDRGANIDEYYAFNFRSSRIVYYLTAGNTYYIKAMAWSGKTGQIYFYPLKVPELYYNANGGSGAPSVQTEESTWGLSSLNYTVSSITPTRNNYTFLGWSTNSNATYADYYSGSSIKMDYNVNSLTLYAVWQYNPPTSYTLYYNANGGSGAPSSQSGSTTYTISSTRPTRSGYTFLGWSTSSSATSASYTAGDTITLSSNTTLYAVWRYNAPTTYTLSYNANGGSGAPSSQSGSTTYTISSIRPTRSGYTFLGWSKSSSSYATANYSAGDTITLTSNTTLYAVWKANSSSNNNIKITIRNNPGTVNLNYGDTIRLYADAENLPSNARIGWYVDDGSTISAKVSDDNTYCEITAKGTGTVTIAAKAVDANGNIMTDSQGNQIGDIQKINTKTSFWLKIVSFFKNLFGANRTTIQALKNVF